VPKGGKQFGGIIYIHNSGNIELMLIEQVKVLQHIRKISAPVLVVSASKS
jgi:hypothetical protein